MISNNIIEMTMTFVLQALYYRFGFQFGFPRAAISVDCDDYYLFVPAHETQFHCSFAALADFS